MDAVTAYRTASERNDIHALIETLGDNAELISPLSGRLIFRGKEDLRVLLDAIYSSIDDLHWTEEAVGDHIRVVLGAGRVGPLHLSDAMVFELNGDGTIHRTRPHLRPWLAVTVLALRLGAKLARHPGVLIRAARS